MKINTLSLEKAIDFIPSDKTYAIRIFNTTQKYFGELYNSKNYIHISQYVFDEDKPDQIKKTLEKYGKIFLPTTLFSESLATLMIEEFLPFRENAESLLIHCFGGGCRSKSIGKGFNDLFGWENNDGMFLNRYGQLQCPHIYRIFMNAGKKIKI